LIYDDRVPPTAVILRRLLYATQYSFRQGDRVKGKIRIKSCSGLIWRSKENTSPSLPGEQYPIECDKNKEDKLDERDPEKDDQNPPPAQKTGSESMLEYPLYRIGKDVDKSQLSSTDFLDQDEYCCEGAVSEIENALLKQFPRGGCLLLDATDRNPDVVVNIVKYNIPGTKRWSMVLSGQSVFSETRVTSHFSSINRALFIGSSNEIGNGVKRDRMYRCSVYPENGQPTPQDDRKLASSICGIFSITSDRVAMGCVGMCDTEIFFAEFAVKIMGIVNQVIATRAGGKFHVQCIIQNLLCQNLLSGMSSST
jgi:hypothetical protein